MNLRKISLLLYSHNLIDIFFLCLLVVCISFMWRCSQCNNIILYHFGSKIYHPFQRYPSRLKSCRCCDVGKVSTRFGFLLSGFAILLGLFLKRLGLDAELNSASNGAISTRGHRRKSATCAQNTGFPRECFKVFAVQIRYTTWVISKTTWVMCRIKFCIERCNFHEGSLSKKCHLCPKYRFFSEVFKVFAVRIRYATWVISKTAWVRCEIQFCIEWCNFH